MTPVELLAKRRRSKVRQVPLARKLGLNNETITDIENERIGVDDETAQRISAAIDQVADEQRDREEVRA